MADVDDSKFEFSPEEDGLTEEERQLPLEEQRLLLRQRLIDQGGDIHQFLEKKQTAIGHLRRLAVPLPLVTASLLTTEVKSITRYAVDAAAVTLAGLGEVVYRRTKGKIQRQRHINAHNVSRVAQGIPPYLPQPSWVADELNRAK